MSARIDTSLTWSNSKVVPAMPSIMPRITNRPVDLTMTPDKRFAAPSKYVWVLQYLPRTEEGIPEGCDEVAELSIRHLQSLPFVYIHRLLPPPGLGQPPYVRWNLPSTAADQALMWRVLKLSPEYLNTFKAFAEPLTKRGRPVFVESHNGLPLGRWLHDLCSRQNRVTALFIQTFGDR